MTFLQKKYIKFFSFINFIFAFYYYYFFLVTKCYKSLLEIAARKTVVLPFIFFYSIFTMFLIKKFSRGSFGSASVLINNALTPPK